MPGIVAIIGNYSDQDLLFRMTSSIKHENWQLTDCYLRPGLAIGRVHLGTINPESQPIFNENESICILMYGEIFNSEKERKKLEERGHKFRVGNDPDVCLHMFEEYGEDFVSKLNGSFVLLIYDKSNETVLVANDRYGLRPLYYSTDGNRFILSSEVKAFLQDKTFKRDVDDEAVADFFAFGMILGNKTFFKKIRMMPSGSIMKWSDGRISQKKYWDIKFERNSTRFSEEYYTNRLVSLFVKAVERRTRGKHRLGVFLSGGLDSRTIAGALSKSGTLIALTYGYPGGDEAAIAGKVAEKLKIKHELIEFKDDFLVSYAEKAVYITDGMLNCAHIFWNCLFPVARENTDIVFTGAPGELLGTELSRVAFRRATEKLSSMFLEQEISNCSKDMFADLLYKEVNRMITDQLAPSFYSQEYFQKIKTFPHKSFQEYLKTLDGTDPINTTDCFWLKAWPRFNLSMVLLRNFVEARGAHWDNDFFDFILKIPSEMRYGYGLYFRFLCKLLPELTEIPYQRTGFSPKWPPLVHTVGYLVKGGYKFFIERLREITGGLISIPQKIGYPDLNQCIRNDPKTKEFFKSVLLDERTLARSYFNRKFIIKMLTEHMNGSKNWGTRLCALLTFELWNRYFIDVQ